MKKDQVLIEAANLINGERSKDYGPIMLNHRRIAAGWEVILGVGVTPHQVAMCMAWLKIARLIHSDNHLDSYVDAVAYMAIAGELATEPDTV